MPTARRNEQPPPLLVGFNLTGNYSLLEDPGIALPSAWMPDGPGVDEQHAAEGGRGKAAGAWPIEPVIDRGHTIVTF